MQTTQIEQDVLEVLAAGRAEDTRFYLPEGPRLERGLYERVNKVLGRMGGKWKGGKVQAHVFERDVTGIIARALDTGSFVDEKKEFQFFETPRAVAQRMMELANIRACQMILEPSAGRGALARVIRETLELHVGCALLVCEKNQFMRERLIADGYSVAAFPDFDFLKYKPGEVNRVFDRIIQNPPFSKYQDAEHLIHAFDCLAPGGRVVSVMSSGITFRSDGAYREARALVNDLGGTVEQLPEGAFKESGTNVKACLVVVDKSE